MDELDGVIDSYAPSSSSLGLPSGSGGGGTTNPDFRDKQESESNFFSTLEGAINSIDSGAVADTGINIVDEITAAPERIHRFADSLNDTLIDIAERFRGGASETAKENLTQNKISEYARKAAKWIQEPGNMVIGGIALLIFIWLVRRF